MMDQSLTTNLHLQSVRKVLIPTPLSTPHTTLTRVFVDCNTVRNFACSNGEQSNERSGTRLRTESETGERRYGRVRLASFDRVRLLRHVLPISLLILRKKTDCFAVQCIRNCSHDSTLGSLSNDDGDSSTKMSLKKCSRAASNFIALIPSRSICQMLAICSRVEF